MEPASLPATHCPRPDGVCFQEEIPMPHPITILLVDDHEVVRQGLRAYLSTDPEFAVVGEAGSGREAVQCAADLIPDVVLMDLVMPGMDGVEATRQVRSVSPRTQVVVLTSYH